MTCFVILLSIIRVICVMGVIECVSPVCPEEMDWSQLYPAHFSQRGDTEVQAQVEFADIGCGYGGLLGMNDET